jgi:DNA-directed RNA polymerase subunit H (RpoH/RPB5)
MPKKLTESKFDPSSFSNIQNSLHSNVDFLLSKIVNTTEEMLLSRGYTCVERHNYDAKKGLYMTARNGEKKVNVIFSDEVKVGVKQIRPLFESSKDDVHFIIVSAEGPTAFCRKEFETNPSISFFVAKDLVNNITKHCLVPKHELVDSAPFCEDKEKLPKILSTDKVCQFYDFKPGSIIKIERLFGGCEPIMYYRLVVDG